MKRTLCLAMSLTLGSLALPGLSAHAAPPGTAKPGPAKALSPGEGSPARRYFTDVVLVNQHGEQMRFYTDLIKGKVVAINSFFGDCTGSCPIIMRSFSQIQEALGDRLGKEVSLLSLSVDPLTDTPSRLMDYARKLSARPGWYFLTGKKENVDQALFKLGQSVQAKEAHLNIVIIGNERTGLWKKAFALAPPDQLIRLVEGVLQDR